MLKAVDSTTSPSVIFPAVQCSRSDDEDQLVQRVAAALIKPAAVPFYSKLDSVSASHCEVYVMYGTATPVSFGRLSVS